MKTPCHSAYSGYSANTVSGVSYSATPGTPPLKGRECYRSGVNGCNGELRIAITGVIHRASAPEAAT